MEKSLYKITGTPLGSWHNRVERHLGWLQLQLHSLAIEEIIRQGMHKFLDSCQWQMNEVGTKIFQTFFTLESTQVR